MEFTFRNGVFWFHEDTSGQWGYLPDNDEVVEMWFVRSSSSDVGELRHDLRSFQAQFPTLSGKLRKMFDTLSKVGLQQVYR